MEGIFLKLLNMSITASWLVLAIVILRLLFRKAPKAMHVVMWALVGIRLIFPVSVESVLSLVPSAETVPEQILMGPSFDVHTGIQFLDNRVNDYLGDRYFEGVSVPANNGFQLMGIFTILWFVGMAVMLLYTVISYYRIHKKVQEAVVWKENVWLCDQISTPFILGILRPRIFLPVSIAETDMEYVIAHETAHLKRRDHWWKPLGFLLLTVYWFNPIIWVAYILLCRDIELACDEKVIRTLGMESKKMYSDALINCSVPRKWIAACPLAFGEVGVKGRVKTVLHYKKPALWIMIVAIIVCIAVAVCFLTNPKSEASSDLDGLSVEIVSMDLSGERPYIEVKWTNHTLKDLTCGEAFYIYREQDGNWKDCRMTEDYIVYTIGYSLPVMGTFQKKYYLHDIDLTQPGQYRFESSCTTNHDSADGLQEYKVWAEFELKHGMEENASREFKASAIVYDCGMFSFVQRLHDVPTYQLGDSMRLQEISADGERKDLGTMKEITLDEEKFDSRLGEGIFLPEDVSAAQLRRNNKRAWELLCDGGDDDIKCLYLLLEQDDGTFYLGFGYYDFGSEVPRNADDSLIRWLYQMVETSAKFS